MKTRPHRPVPLNERLDSLLRDLTEREVEAKLRKVVGDRVGNVVDSSVVGPIWDSAFWGVLEIRRGLGRENDTRANASR